MITPEAQRLEDREHNEYVEVLSHIQAMLATTSGRMFFKYIFKNFDIGEVPEFGMPENLLRDRLGFLRAGKSFFDLVAAAAPDQAASILAQVVKEKNV